eukprot:TRINITY_DN8128_c0_g1_i1.p1 TRINITY_DN8128_c0_g1~~TRINITY_DN8128_c0_g1_i1.p1  ORF type:complete len:635 (+),score=135.89 TRINITY_DN8128_c0_g1_i1:70-1974(+)
MSSSGGPAGSSSSSSTTRVVRQRSPATSALLLALGLPEFGRAATLNESRLLQPGLLHRKGRLVSRTCRASCAQAPAGGAAAAVGSWQAEQVFGSSSRCFEAAFDEEPLYACFEVQCLGDEYRIRTSSSQEVVCKGSQDAKQQFAGQNLSVHCDSHGSVCGASSVLRTLAEVRREAVWEELMSAHAAHSSSAVDHFMEAYDWHRFEPHLREKEKAVDSAYMAEVANSSCEWGSELEPLIVDRMPQLRLVSFRNVTTDALVKILSSNCSVYVQQVHRLNVSSTTVPWGLDSLDGLSNGQYCREYSGKGVDVFVYDSGVDPDHPELAGRVADGIDCTKTYIEMRLGDKGTTKDEVGHGTHVAGTIAGRSVGVAPSATIVPFRVAGYEGDSDNTLRAIDYTLAEKKRRGPSGAPIVVSASLGGARSKTVNGAFRLLVEDGIPTMVAAGNHGEEVADFSPASEPSVITVGAVDRKGRVPSFSNYGPLVDIWAPGVAIESADHTGGLKLLDGTSMATPHVSGVAALLLEKHASWTHAEVQEELLSACRERTPALLRIVRSFASVAGSDCKAGGEPAVASCTGTVTTTTNKVLGQAATTSVAEEAVSGAAPIGRTLVTSSSFFVCSIGMVSLLLLAWPQEM